MAESIVASVFFSLLAAGLTLAAVRGKWIVFRLLAGSIGFVATLLALVGWIVSAAMIWTRPEGDAESQLYIGWHPRALWGLPGLVLILLYAGYMALVLWLGDRHQRKKLQGRG